MNLADADAVVLKPPDCFLRLLKLHSQMAGVVIDSEMLCQTWVTPMFGAHLLQELDRFRARFQIAQRLGFQPKMKFLAALLAYSGNVLDALPQVRAHSAALVIVGNEFFERARHGAYTSLDTFGQQLRQQVEQPIRVGNALARGPVRRIHLLLHAGAMKFAVRKSVDGEDVTVLAFEPPLKRAQHFGIPQLARSLVAQS